MNDVYLESESFPCDYDFLGKNEESYFNNNGNITFQEKMDLFCDGNGENICQDFGLKSNDLNINKSLLEKTDYCCDNFNLAHNTFDFYKSFKNNFEENSIDSFQSTDDADNKYQRVLFNNKEKDKELLSNSIKVVTDKEFLNKKRKKEKIFDIEKTPKEKKMKKIAKNNPNHNHNFGRKKKTDKNNRKHNKTSGDNIINKIKGYFFNYIRDITNKNSIYTKIDFKKLPREFISDLSKSKNERLYKMKIKDVLSEEKISTKYSTLQENENELIINKIYKEGKETRIIQILELTFKELFIIFRRKLNYLKDEEEMENIAHKIEGLDLLENDNYFDFGYLIEEIIEKNKNMEEPELEKYVYNVKKLCCNYEKWFNVKIGRISKNK